MLIAALAYRPIFWKLMPMTTRNTEQPLPTQGIDPTSAGLQAILDNIDALVYVADFKTHNLLYMNAYGRSVWGDFTEGQKCWEVLQNADGPCSFCTNHLLIGSDGHACGIHVWEFKNEISQRWYQCRDQAITWTDGQLARLEIATDITDRKNIEMALQKAQQNAEALSLQDELTGLNNRRAFFQIGGQFLKQAQRHQSPMAAVMFDLDHFKQINDSHGHEAGDTVLREVGKILLANVRESDIAARVGGEEFAVLLPSTSQALAMDLAERLRLTLQELQIHYRQTVLQVTASIGVAMLSADDGQLEPLLSRADEAMYISKTEGRNKVSLFLQRRN